MLAEELVIWTIVGLALAAAGIMIWRGDGMPKAEGYSEESLFDAWRQRQDSRRGGPRAVQGGAGGLADEEEAAMTKQKPMLDGRESSDVELAQSRRQIENIEQLLAKIRPAKGDEGAHKV